MVSTLQLGIEDIDCFTPEIIKALRGDAANYMPAIEREMRDPILSADENSVKLCQSLLKQAETWISLPKISEDEVPLSTLHALTS